LPSWHGAQLKKESTGQLYLYLYLYSLNMTAVLGFLSVWAIRYDYMISVSCTEDHIYVSILWVQLPMPHFLHLNYKEYICFLYYFILVTPVCIHCIIHDTLPLINQLHIPGFLLSSW
jgi:hypothetical protein